MLVMGDNKTQHAWNCSTRNARTSSLVASLLRSRNCPRASEILFLWCSDAWFIRVSFTSLFQLLQMFQKLFHVRLYAECVTKLSGRSGPGPESRLHSVSMVDSKDI